MKKYLIFFTIALGAIFMFGTFSLAEYVPNVINYQGHLTDVGGSPVPDGDYDMVFRIYDWPVGPTELWSSGSQSVHVEDGQFSYMLGSVVPLPDMLFSDTNRYLGITVGTDPEIVPRTRLVTVPYAFCARYGGGWTGDPGTVYLTTSSDKVGIGSDTPTAKLTVMASGTNTAGYFYGNGEIGLYAYTSLPTGLPNAYAVHGHVAGGDGSNKGVYGLASQGYTGIGLYGSAWGNSNASYGAVGSANSPVDAAEHHTGVMGSAENALIENTGVEGHALGDNTTNYGVIGGASGVDANNYGVYGVATNGIANWAGYFAGDVRVTGTFDNSKSAILIDHPLDPENQYLCHSSVNSPDMKNVYDGVAALDANGEATVTLPEYFEALNKDFRYQLTCIGGYAPVYIAEEISNNQFRISGGQAGMKISWQVTGIRKDAYAESNGLQVEIDKSESDRGFYLHPEVYGFDKTKSINRSMTLRQDRKIDY